MKTLQPAQVFWTNARLAMKNPVLDVINIYHY